jgi:hypothetical protein
LCNIRREASQLILDQESYKENGHPDLPVNRDVAAYVAWCDQGIQQIRDILDGRLPLDTLISF